MPRRTEIRPVRALALLLAAALLAAVAVDAARAETIVAVGTGQYPVTPEKPRSEASIRAAVREAQAESVPLAVADARRQARLIGGAAGLTVGAIQSVEQQFGAFTAYYVGPLAGAYCRTVPRRVRTVDEDGTVRVVRRGTQRRCTVPPAASTTLSVTFAAVPGPVVVSSAP